MKRNTIALFLTLTIVGCASSVKTSVDYDRSIDFSRYRTYGWLPSQKIGNDILERRLTSAIDRALAARGLTRSDDPDLRVAMHGRLSKEVEYTATGAGWGYGWRRWGGPTRVRREEVPVGTLIVDVVDAKDKELVWRGTATTPIDRTASAEKREEAVGEAVEKLFAGFPPRR